MQATILVVEDNKDVRFSARMVLEDAGFQLIEQEDPLQAIAFLQQQSADLILLDMNFSLDTTSGEEGLRFLRWLKQQGSSIPLIAMTAWSNTALVVEAMQLGAADFIEKPWHNQRLLQVIQQQLKLTALQHQNQQLNEALNHSDEELIWQSPQMQRLTEQLKAVAQSDANVLLTGENGTGKSQLAQFIHRHSKRAKAPLISMNMGAIAESLFESEMFGHKKGAFTDAKEHRIGRFALAKGGSLFLDEVANLPLSQQAKLLRVLESGHYEVLGSSTTEHSDVRLISASNGDFAQLMGDGLFRQDLYYRLNTLEFRVPALRERPEDILPLCRFFLHKHGMRYHKTGLALQKEAEKRLLQYPWPGNIRELSHLIERAVLLSQSASIHADELALPRQHSVPPGSKDAAALPMLTLEQAERRLIQQALSHCQGNKQKSAELLGITKSSLYRRLEKYGFID
ncbi:sigma-54-dependent transcriptional regulator [Alkalimonas amylolytica]|uniref:DNA-binding transcriptional response regulator, NtrC family, contains REC, AAA-type ATPase, and a Fis-type DNA-binding domains n=1 Tax=Alkalimonas amylolytica TaxID=152573 RepID=A0A1H4G2H3_ALKAM|nr:sigma-54 dependent transcriptional regulator [Alkalimonas amylolytica]SEB03734.1 DNA-binding transcriptional response regulator, NtrC family, contains REC, AAA-type ATPase, and a Fis-type DNA-binding domains [Alkalimonas amylolytica]